MRRVLVATIGSLIALTFVASATTEARPRTVKFDLGYPAGSIIVINNERALYHTWVFEVCEQVICHPISLLNCRFLQ